MSVKLSQAFNLEEYQQLTCRIIVNKIKKNARDRLNSFSFTKTYLSFSVGKGLFVTFFIAYPCNLQNEQLKNVLQCYKNFANEEFFIELDEHSEHKILLETSPNTGQEKKELVILKALTRAASTDFNNNFVSGEATQTAVDMYKFKPEG